MKCFCFDTSGLSNPLESMPEDIHQSMWAKVMGIISNGEIAVTTEIYEEMIHIPGALGNCIKAHKQELVLEINKGNWNWTLYATFTAEMNTIHHQYISEYCGGSPKTVSLNDMSIIALAKALGLPVVSMEASAKPSVGKRRVPDICNSEGVKHLTFSEFLRAKNITV